MGGRAYTYNAANELASSATAVGNFVYTYDGHGNLANTSLSSIKIQETVWDLNNPLPMAAEDTTGTGTTTADYIYGPAATLESTLASGSAYYPVTDWLGSLTGLINSSGTQVTSASYSAYGKASITSLTGSAPIPSIGYAGSYNLPGGDGLGDMRSRLYDSITGSFMTSDPILVMTGQPYAYAGDSPVAVTDPSGAITCPS